MRLVALIFLACLPAFAGKSLEVTADSGTYTTPAGAPWSTLGERRLEMRVDLTGLSCPATNQTFWSFAGLAVRCSTAGAGSLWVFYDPASQGASISYSGRTDTLVRVQFDPTNDKATIEFWDVDGTNYLLATRNSITVNSNDAASTAYTVGGGQTFDIAWARQYSTLLPLASSAPPNPSSNNGDLGDWEFEDVLTDSSSHAMDVSITGTAYVTSPVINPVSNAIQLNQPTWQTLTVQRAGEAVSWDGTTSISGADADPALTYVWSDQTVGGGLTISSSTASQPTISCVAFGEYIVRLVVTDADTNTDSIDVTVGCVTADSLYRVTYADPDVEFLLGPMIMWGKSPWPYLDERHAAYADFYGPDISAQTAPRYADDWNDNLTGTIAVTNADATVTGTSTTFQTDFCSGGTTPDANTNFVIHDAAGEDWDFTVSSCTSQTSLELTDTYTKTTDSGLNFSKWDDCLGCWYGGSDHNNYYDNVLALYALHYRTGFTIYRTYARDLAVLWDDMPRINSGFGASTNSRSIANRSWGFTGLALWAKETAQPNAWWDNFDTTMANWEASIDTTTDFVDMREDGYAFAYVALAAKLHYDATERTALEAVLTSALGATKRFITADYKQNEAWSNVAFGLSCGGTLITVTNGSTAVTGTGGSWLSAGATDWLGVVPSGGSDRRLITPSDAMRIASIESDTALTLVNNWPGPTQTDRDTTVGGCRLNTQVGAGTTPFQLSMGMMGMYWTDDVLGGNATAVDEVLDAAEWFDSTGYQSSTRGSYFTRGFANCEPDPEDVTNGGTNCNSSTEGARFFNLEMIRAMSAAYQLAVENGDPRASDILIRGDDIFSAIYDGGFGGPGTDGTWPTELDDTPTVEKPKNFGFAFGWGGGWSWPAARLLVSGSGPTVSGAATISGDVTF